MGIELLSDDNVVQGNLVGTNAAGTAAVPNTVGVHVETGSDRNRIGGTAAGEGNVISGNTEDGVLIDPAATGNDVEGNVIGLNAPATRAGPQRGGRRRRRLDRRRARQHGRRHRRRRGQRDRRQRGRRRAIVGVNATDNQVLANLIGTNAAGADLGNRGSGVEIADGARNDVGTPDAAVPVNTIAYNGDDGVTVAGVASASTVVRQLDLRQRQRARRPGDRSRRERRDAERRAGRGRRQQRAPEPPGDGERRRVRGLDVRRRRGHAAPAALLRQRRLRHLGPRRGADPARLGLRDHRRERARGGRRALAAAAAGSWSP